MSDKDYSLLRPFDLEAAKRGDEFLFISPGNMEQKTRKLVAEKNGQIVIDYGDTFQISTLDFASSGYMMAPLCWVEGKPVYKGDALYNKSGKRRTVTGISEDGVFSTEEHGDFTVHQSDCTWVAQKVKHEGWVNIYPSCSSNRVADTSHVHVTREAADRQSISHRIACVRIEWEEQP